MLLPAAPARALSEADYFAFADRIARGCGPSGTPPAGCTSRGRTAPRRARTRTCCCCTRSRRCAGTPARRGGTSARARLVDRMTRAADVPARRARTPRARPDGLLGAAADVERARPHLARLAGRRGARVGVARTPRAQALARRGARGSRRSIDRCARHPGWRFPHAARRTRSTGTRSCTRAPRASPDISDLLRRDYRRHLAALHRRHHAAAAGDALAEPRTGLRLPLQPAPAGVGAANFDTPEYANIVATALQYHARARQAGMKPLPERSVGAAARLGHAAADRVVDARRLPQLGHRPRLAALALRPVLGVRAAGAARDRGRARVLGAAGVRALGQGDLRPRAAALRALGGEAGGVLAPQQPVRRLPRPPRSGPLRHAHRRERRAGDRARAGPHALLGPAAALRVRPRGRRLAVTTPRYSTAIVPDNHGAFAYGGIDLARLFGPGQRVAANIGGEPPDAFGVVVRDAAGHEVLASQHGRVHRGRAEPAPRAAPRRVQRSPGGRRRLARAAACGSRPRHRFRHGSIDERWDVRCRGRCGPFTVDVHLPSWGEDAVIDAIRRDGSRVRLARAARRSRWPTSSDDRARRGYAATPTHRAPGAVLLPVATTPQRTDPAPGPDARDPARRRRDGRRDQPGPAAGAGGRATGLERSQPLMEQGTRRRAGAPPLVRLKLALVELAERAVPVALRGRLVHVQCVHLGASAVAGRPRALVTVAFDGGLSRAEHGWPGRRSRGRITDLAPSCYSPPPTRSERAHPTSG